MGREEKETQTKREERREGGKGSIPELYYNI